jgi:transcriptional regulator with XRE-family HTH domain
VHDHRRVSGLRREELAMLAGVTSDYYTRLEQGRSLPSEHVTRALAQALRLDEAATGHLHQLARRVPESHVDDDESSSRALQPLLDQWTLTPAWVSDRYAEIHAANALATALNPYCTPGGNALKALFVEEGVMREIYVDYDEVAQEGVASLRARNGADVDDRQLTDLVTELSRESTHFARLWSQHDVRFHTDRLRILRLRHKVAGRMEFRMESMLISGSAGSLLTVYYADPASATARNVSRLL